MSLATLKRKTQSKYRCLSGRNSGDKFVINKSSPGNPTMFISLDTPRQGISQNNKTIISGPGGGFSINGSRRNVRGVGVDMKVSKGLGMSKSVSIGHTRVPVMQGFGGCCGKYNRSSSGLFGIQSCSDNSKLVHPSTLSFKSMINSRNRWVKLTAPADFFTSNNLEPPKHPNQVQLTSNNWVKMLGNGNVDVNTQQQYITDSVATSNICMENRYSDVPTKGQSLNNTYIRSNKCSSHIGGKYKTPTPFSKQTMNIISASEHNYIVKRNRGTLPSFGWQQAWPKHEVSTCSKYTIVPEFDSNTLGSASRNRYCDPLFQNAYNHIIQQRTNCN